MKNRIAHYLLPEVAADSPAEPLTDFQLQEQRIVAGMAGDKAMKALQTFGNHGGTLFTVHGETFRLELKRVK